MHYIVYSITSIELKYTTRRWCWQRVNADSNIMYFVCILRTLGQAQVNAAFKRMVKWVQLEETVFIHEGKQSQGKEESEWFSAYKHTKPYDNCSMYVLQISTLSLSHGKDKGKVAPVHATIAPLLILNASTRYRWVVSLTQPPPQKQSAQSLYVNTSHNSKFGCMK
jgi:hypothetical protein